MWLEFPEAMGRGIPPAKRLLQLSSGPIDLLVINVFPSAEPQGRVRFADDYDVAFSSLSRHIRF